MTTKFQRILQLLEKHALDALLIQQVANFAWATDGAASYVNTASTTGTGTLLITKDSRHLITNRIEAPRYQLEEKLAASGWEIHADPWYQPSETLIKLTGGLRVGADIERPGALNLAAELAIVRSYLDAEEQARFRALGADCAAAMDEAIRAVRPGMSEYQIAGLLAKAAQARGAQPIVNLIATDERIYKFRHPLPTEKKMDKYAMLVLCGRQKGLVCSITRLVHFGALPTELAQKARAVAAIDAAMISATRPGKTVAEVFQITREAYARAGFADEWQLHHQGGPASYDARDVIANPGVNVPVGVGQAYAWNPSITGCKSEDTILVGEAGNQILTVIPGWPVIPIEIDGQTIARPDILVVQ